MTKQKIFHSFLLTIFPILFLYANNKDLVHPSYALWPLVLTLLLSIALFLFIEHFLRNTKKTAVLVSVFVVSFFSFGHCLELISLFLAKLARENIAFNILLIIWFIFLVVVTHLVIKSKKSFQNLTTYLNTASIILVALPILTIGWYESHTKSIDTIIANENSLINVEDIKEKPDIYYIILDGYGREDVLSSYYNFDNGEFIADLEKKGFFVAKESTANYPQTYLSVASSLNYTYLDLLSQEMGISSNDRGPLREMIKESEIYHSLKKVGYKFVAFPYTWTGTYNNLHADIFMQNKLNSTEFTDLVIHSTPLRIFSNTNIKVDEYRNKFHHAFIHLPDVAKIEKPTFTYIHLIMPHPPFVFGKNGEKIVPTGRVAGNDGSHYFKEYPGVDNYRKQYIEQLQYISSKISITIDSILANSETPPIIILQSDHGPGSMLDWEHPENTNMHERMSILNAYYVPEEAKAMLYDSISPVNSFRVVFNTLFDAELELLEDRSYFSRWSRPYDFIDVTEEVKNY